MFLDFRTAKNRLVDFHSIHANGRLQSATISINLASKTSISFFVMGFSIHDSNKFLFFVVSSLNFFLMGLSFEAADDDDNVDTLDVDVESCSSSPKFST